MNNYKFDSNTCTLVGNCPTCGMPIWAIKASIPNRAHPECVKDCKCEANKEEILDLKKEVESLKRKIDSFENAPAQKLKTKMVLSD